MFDHVLLLFAGVVAVAGFALRRHPKFGPFVSVAAPVAILASVVWVFVIPKRSAPSPIAKAASSAAVAASAGNDVSAADAAAAAASGAVAAAVAAATAAAAAPTAANPRQPVQPAAAQPSASMPMFDWSRARSALRQQFPSLEPSPIYGPDSRWWRGVVRPPAAVIVRPQGEINLRECAGAGCEIVAQLQRNARLLRTGNSDTIESDSGAQFEWIEVSTAGSRYCLPEALDADDACTEWINHPPLTGWVNRSLTRDPE